MEGVLEEKHMASWLVHMYQFASILIPGHPELVKEKLREFLGNPSHALSLFLCFPGNLVVKLEMN